MGESSKSRILESLRSADVPDVPLPELDAAWTEFENPLSQFADVTQAVGGTAVVVKNLQEVNAQLAEIPAYRDAQKVCSLVKGIERANVESDSLGDPHESEDIDFFVVEGQFGVAENGAVWVTDASAKHRVLYFICQHMALVLPASQMVSNMHQAYDRLVFGDRQFGMFLAGPSKTADIEQSLVIGAHGARSLTVFLVQD